jgi:hypothetical protein
MIFENDYSDSDDEEDKINDIPDYIQEEIKLNNQLESITMFKNCIRNQPKFMAIDNVSGIELLNFIKSNNTHPHDNLDIDEVNLFDDLYIAIFGIKGSKEVYENVAYKIFKKCYV